MGIYERKSTGRRKGTAFGSEAANMFVYVCVFSQTWFQVSVSELRGEKTLNPILQRLRLRH